MKESDGFGSTHTWRASDPDVTRTGAHCRHPGSRRGRKGASGHRGGAGDHGGSPRERLAPRRGHAEGGSAPSSDQHAEAARRRPNGVARRRVRRQLHHSGPGPTSSVPSAERAAFRGDFPPIEERLVVSPGWGHLHRRRIREGRSLVPGAVIGEIRAGGIRTLVRTPAAGNFVSWLVSEGDTVDTGRPLARIQP